MISISRLQFLVNLQTNYIEESWKSHLDCVDIRQNVSARTPIITPAINTLI